MEEDRRETKHTVETIHNARCLPDLFLGCLLGGAVGDALGALVEDMPSKDILARCGLHGACQPADVFEGGGTVTVHTQLALFTAEGILRAKVKAEEFRTPLSMVPPVYNAYQRWLATQDGIFDEQLFKSFGGGRLIRHRELYRVRCPEQSCVDALTSGKLGQATAPINDNRGCGAAVRMAPLGLFYCSENVFRRFDPTVLDDMVFENGCRLAALTHGHPDAFLTAGCQALLIFRLIRGDELYNAVHKVLNVLSRRPRHEPCRSRLEDVMVGEHIGDSPDCGFRLSASHILAQALRCALDAHEDFQRGLLSAVALGGPSAGRGVLTGQLLGACLGREAIPPEWLRQLELRDVISRMAEDLFVGFEPSADWLDKYPAW